MRCAHSDRRDGRPQDRIRAGRIRQLDEAWAHSRERPSDDLVFDRRHAEGWQPHGWTCFFEGSGSSSADMPLTRGIDLAAAADAPSETGCAEQRNLLSVCDGGNIIMGLFTYRALEHASRSERLLRRRVRFAIGILRRFAPGFNSASTVNASFKPGIPEQWLPERTLARRGVASALFEALVVSAQNRVTSVDERG